ncbi:MAG: manganese efflux pump MntP family protein [Elusimicrobiota bacterium]
MSWPVLLAVAVGLAMDAMSVALAVGATRRELSRGQLFRLSWHFGLFQAFMPAIGWGVGQTILPWIERWDHWVACALLTLVGLKAIRESLTGESYEAAAEDPTRGWTLLALSVATSIDALAVGLSFAALGLNIVAPCLVIGVVTGALTLAGMLAGGRLGKRFGSGMGVLGGVVLIAIGIKIVLEHMAG